MRGGKETKKIETHQDGQDDIMLGEGLFHWQINLVKCYTDLPDYFIIAYL